MSGRWSNAPRRICDIGIAGGWAGLYEVTPDHNALIGEAERRQALPVRTGFSGHGFLQAPRGRRDRARPLLGRAPFVDISPLSASRFRRAETRRERAIV